jgi:hypothetical protein
MGQTESCIKASFGQGISGGGKRGPGPNTGTPLHAAAEEWDKSGRTVWRQKSYPGHYFFALDKPASAGAVPSYPDHAHAIPLRDGSVKVVLTSDGRHVEPWEHLDSKGKDLDCGLKRLLTKHTPRATFEHEHPLVFYGSATRSKTKTKTKTKTPQRTKTRSKAKTSPRATTRTRTKTKAKTRRANNATPVSPTRRPRR